MGDNFTIYHCCIQKTASQWIKSIFLDEIIKKKVNKEIVIPEKNFIGTNISDEDIRFIGNSIITPLYIDYIDFIKKINPENYRAFFVMRDPRDFIISYYFSIKYSHSDNPYVQKIRKDIDQLDESESISYFIRKLDEELRSIINTLLSWKRNQNNSNDTRVYRYEDLIGNSNLPYFIDLFDFIKINLKKKDIKKLLLKYSFKNLTQGRTRGEEDIKNHYRKGIAGDWKNHFTIDHKDLFKEVAGDQLIELEYESDNLW